MHAKTDGNGFRKPMFAAVALLCSAGAAFAVGAASHELGAGARVSGDISKEAGETDRFGLDLLPGQELAIKLSAGFDASLVLRDADGATVDLGVTHGRKLSARKVIAGEGRHELTIASADASQGTYKLTASAAWPKKLAVSGDGTSTLEIWMPAGGSFKGKLVCSAGDATITSVEGPSGAQIAGPITGSRGKVSWKSLRAPADGLYRVNVDAPGAFSGTVARKVPKSRAAKLDVRNGLSTTSFARDGVAELFASRCSDCHTWANDYDGVSAFAKQAYARMKTGNMPQTGPRVVGSDLALVATWIKSGMAR